MADVIKHITFRSRDLGEDVSLMLCFTPPGLDLFVNQFPVAWKVDTLHAVGSSYISVTYDVNSTLGVCSAQVSGAGNTVVAGTHIPISPGQTTTLLCPIAGEYMWTPPETIGGASIRAENETYGPVGIGYGFYTKEGMAEKMNTAVVYPKVDRGLAVSAEVQPILNAYIGLKYKENEIIRSEIIDIDPLWKANLFNVWSNTTIWIRKTSRGGYRADLVSGNIGEEPSRGLDLPFDATYVFHATLSFAYPDLVVGTLQDIMRNLLRKGYRVKVVAKDGEKEARIELNLPPRTSCEQAEKELLASVHTCQWPLPVAIKERYAERLVWTAGNASSWEPVNLATIDWYVNGNQNTKTGLPGILTGPYAVPGLAVENGNAKTEANGTANEDADKAGFLFAKAGGPERVNGNTRLVRKKSAVDINGAGDDSTA